MELRVYLRLLINKRWVVLSPFLVTLALTAVFTFAQAPVYRSAATFVVRPNISSENPRDQVSGLEVLSRLTEIPSTYVEVANSRLIKQRAAEKLGVSSEQATSLSVQSRLLAGTNVLSIAVFGKNPTVVRNFADAVGDETAAYVQQLYEAYELAPLDRATLPAAPVKPNKWLNLALGACLGLALGAGLAFLAEYLQAPLEPATVSGLDEEFKEALAEKGEGRRA